MYSSYEVTGVFAEALAHKQRQKVLEKKKVAEEWWRDTAFKWQKEARKLLETWSEEEERQILVVYDPEGNHGKTVFCKKLQDTNPDEIAYIKKSAVDNKNVLLKNQRIKFCMVDYTRDAKKYGNHGMIRFPNVHVAVMTNEPLDWTAFARDQWYVMELFGENNEVATFKIWDEKKMDAEYNKYVSC